MDKDGDGRITEEEVKEIITLSASANKLPRIQEQAEEHAQLIMELDPENLGYIEQFSLETLVLEALRNSSAPVRIGRNQSQMLLLDQSRLRPTPEHGPLRRWCRRRAHDFPELNWRRVWAAILTLALRPGALPVEILKVGVYAGDVLSLQFSKPQRFRYRSGQYILINCPAVSRFQWRRRRRHPFCITSAPHDDYVSVHIRALGDWTCDVKNRFAELTRVCRPVDACDGGATSNLSLPKVLIDGPYGLTAQGYKQYDVVLLVSLGIGAAAMISIIKHIVHNMNRLDDDGIDPGDANNFTSSSSLPSSCRTQRAYFHWITQEQGSFDWFRSAMDEVVETDMKGVVELHNYCTSVYEDCDARSAIIAVLQLLNYAKNGVDIVSGTRVKTRFGKPDWCDVYKRIALNHPDQRVGVFYCGAPVLVKELSELAHDFSRKTTTKFEFHKENF